jgi:hypothetical protein
VGERERDMAHPLGRKICTLWKYYYKPPKGKDTKKEDRRAALAFVFSSSFVSPFVRPGCGFSVVRSFESKRERVFSRLSM